MSTNSKELKVLAEAATQGLWYRGADLSAVCAPLERGKNGCAATICRFPHGTWADVIEHVANATFIAAANPAAILDLIDQLEQALAGNGATSSDYEEVLSDHRRLVRELDVLLNGEASAAKQASLCDIVGQVRRDQNRITRGSSGITLTGQQIAELLDLAAPDRETDPDQLETEMTLTIGDETAHSGPGLYAYWTDYPEEGAVPLFDTATDDDGAADAPPPGISQQKGGIQ